MFTILPQDDGFYDLLDEAASNMVACAQAYSATAHEYDRREQHINHIRELEHKGDDIVHRTLGKLDKTFLTPFDREDIQLLIKRMDDVVDEIDAAAKRLRLYKIAEPTNWLVKQADILLRAALLTTEAIARLRNMRKANGLHDKLVEIHSLENQGDDNNHAAVAELYDTATDAIFAMKWKEIYDRTERAIDRCEDVANTIEGIVLKNT